MHKFFKVQLPDKKLKWAQGFVIVLLMQIAIFADDNYDEKAREYSTYYETLVKRSLSKYYDRTTYIVDARIIISENLIPLEYHKVPKINPNIEHLPGLPVLPEELKDQRAIKSYNDDSLQVSKYKKEYAIKFVEIDVLVDSSYSGADYEFIMDLVKMTANLDEFRGDKINIKTKSFPKKQNAFFPAQAQPDEEVTDKKEEATAEEPMPMSPMEALKENIINQLPILLPLLVMFIFITLLLWMVLKYLKNIKKDGAMAPEPVLAKEMVQEENISKAEAPKEAEAAEQSILKTPEVSGIRTSILNSFVGNPETSSGVLSNWVESNPESGYRETAILVHAIDDRLIDILKPHFTVQQLKKVQIQLPHVIDTEEEKIVATLKKFKENYQTKLNNTKEEAEMSDIFNFLKQLTNQQLLHVLKDEQDGIVGLALAQLHPKQATQILQTFEGEKRAKILVSIGNINNIPVALYKEVADRLSGKALEVGNMKFVAADGVDSIIDVLSGLTMEGQEQYMHSITEMDFSLGQKIKRFFVTFTDMVNVPEGILQKVLQEMDRDELAIALVNAPDNVVQKVLKLFPERMQMMIQSGIETNAASTAEAIENARKKVVMALRSELREIGGLPS